MEKRRSGNQGNRISGKRIEDRRRKTDTGEYRILNPDRQHRDRQGISNSEGGTRMEDGHLRVYTRSLLQRREKPKISAIPEPL